MKDYRVLVVDDEDYMRAAVIETLQRADFPAMTASSAKEAMDLMAHRKFSVVITDVKMPGMDGLKFFQKVKELHPETAVIIMTGYPDLQDAINTLKQGAVDYLQKPFMPQKLTDLVAQFIDYQRDDAVDQLDNLITQDAYMQQILNKVRTVAASNAPVLIQGETGTGKELIAQALHDSSQRSETGKMVAINCAAIPESLLESEMFGAERGAYTGANARHLGKFERAHKGTLFLDEISALSWHLQAKLLRALQEREIERVGGNGSIPVDVRIVASSNEDIEEFVEEGKFRPDLYYRLDVIRIALPPLRQRKCDIPLLADHFLKMYARLYNPRIIGFSDGALKALEAYDWPGNVRQLQNVVQQATIEIDGTYIGTDSLQLNRRNRVKIIEEETLDAIPFKVGMSLHEIEKQAILRTLDAHGGNQTKTAEILRITTRTIRNKLHEYSSQVNALNS
ncbi:MAG: sigma-54 dependent transcriptional regulator [Candidatus Poribacteria bacterium]|nr:sigma-54 dependent transcriptional regulator [Candidatus Poribacteria bacterium]